MLRGLERDPSAARKSDPGGLENGAAGGGKGPRGCQENGTAGVGKRACEGQETGPAGPRLGANFFVPRFGSTEAPGGSIARPPGPMGFMGFMGFSLSFYGLLASCSC